MMMMIIIIIIIYTSFAMINEFHIHPKWTARDLGLMSIYVEYRARPDGLGHTNGVL